MLSLSCSCYCSSLSACATTVWWSMGMLCELYRNSKINGVVKQWNTYMVYLEVLSRRELQSVNERQSEPMGQIDTHIRALLFEWNSVARWTVDTSRFGCSRLVSYRNFFSLHLLSIRTRVNWIAKWNIKMEKDLLNDERLIFCVWNK